MNLSPDYPCDGVESVLSRAYRPLYKLLVLSPIDYYSSLLTRDIMIIIMSIVQ